MLEALGPNGLIAWIDARNDIATLCIADNGRLCLERSLARGDTLDYGYEGCHANYLAWHAGRLVVVTAEHGRSYLRSLAPDGSDEQGVPLTHAWLIEGDLVLWVADEPGLLSAAALPSLDARTPLLFRSAPPPSYIRLAAPEAGWCRVSTSDSEIDTLALPTGDVTVDGLVEALHSRLFPRRPQSESTRLLLESAGYPFLRGAIWRRQWEPSPIWMVAYWRQYLVAAEREAEAKELVQLLKEVAAPLAEHEPEYGWDARWNAREGHIELAVRYIRRQARRLAGVCRTGALPPGAWCLLFDPAPQSHAFGSRVDTAAYPPTLRRIFEELVVTKPTRLAAQR